METIIILASVLINYLLFQLVLKTRFGDVCGAAGMAERTRLEFTGRFVASAHALLAGYLSFKSMFCDEIYDFDTSIFGSNECLMREPRQLHLNLVCISAGYCIFDIYLNAFVIYKGNLMTTEVKEYLAHHIIGLIGALGVLYEGSFNITLACVTLLSVLTDIPMNIRWYLLINKKSRHWLYLPNDFIFIISFFLLRVALIFFII
jgi:hypothetical protein